MSSFDAYEIPSVLDGIPSTYFAPSALETENFFFAFSDRTRNIIKHRSGGVCEVTGAKGQPMECAHLNHAHSASYNAPENGLHVTVKAHLAQHLYFEDYPEEGLGLPRHQNNWAINQLAGRVALMYPEVDPIEEAKKLKPAWDAFFRRR